MSSPPTAVVVKLAMPSAFIALRSVVDRDPSWVLVSTASAEAVNTANFAGVTPLSCVVVSAATTAGFSAAKFVAVRPLNWVEERRFVSADVKVPKPTVPYPFNTVVVCVAKKLLE